MNYIDKMKPIIQKAGNGVMAHFGKALHVDHKKDHSIVTNADLESEKLLKAELLALIPGSGCISEETAPIQGNEFVWVIDPIDGTKNFSRGLPYFCINVALMQVEQVIAAITYYPVMNTWFYAQKGFGAFCNERKLILDKPAWQEKGVLIVISDFRIRQCALLSQIKQRLSSIESGVRFRVYGAAALDLAYTAAGSFDAVLFENLHWWDAAAGKLLVQEAGGWVSRYDGQEYGQKSKSLIAGHKQICDLLMPVELG